MSPAGIPTTPTTRALSIDLHITVEVDSDPIRGTVTTTHGPAAEFNGWIELTQLLERAHKHDPPPADPRRTDPGRPAPQGPFDAF